MVNNTTNNNVTESVRSCQRTGGDEGGLAYSHCFGKKSLVNDSPPIPVLEFSTFKIHCGYGRTLIISKDLASPWVILLVKLYCSLHVKLHRSQEAKDKHVVVEIKPLVYICMYVWQYVITTIVSVRTNGYWRDWSLQQVYQSSQYERTGVGFYFMPTYTPEYLLWHCIVFYFINGS